mgnify:CR=1 FL=1
MNVSLKMSQNAQSLGKTLSNRLVLTLLLLEQEVVSCLALSLAIRFGQINLLVKGHAAGVFHANVLLNKYGDPAAYHEILAASVTEASKYPVQFPFIFIRSSLAMKALPALGEDSNFEIYVIFLVVPSTVISLSQSKHKSVVISWTCSRCNISPLVLGVPLLESDTLCSHHLLIYGERYRNNIHINTTCFDPFVTHTKKSRLAKSTLTFITPELKIIYDKLGITTHIDLRV